jgi:uncharacterized protein YndB with AHSA1/START domain
MLNFDVFEKLFARLLRLAYTKSRFQIRRIVMEFKFAVFARIERPVAQVFSAVQQPQHLQKYFTTKRASAPLTKGATVIWDFADFPGEFPIKVLEVIDNKLIVFEWKAMDDDYNTRTEIIFEPQSDNSTIVRIRESGWQQTEKGLESSYGNCFGWTQMLCCLKVYLEHGINLREGFFKPTQKAA